MKKSLFVKVSLTAIAFYCVALFLFWFGYNAGAKDTRQTYAKKHLINGFDLPIEKENIVCISSKQGLRDMLTIGEAGGAVGGTWHNGFDFACVDRTPVKASKAGKVVCVYPSYYNDKQWKGHPVYGGLVILQHDDNTMSLYAHLSLTEVHEGDVVKRGQEIALSGGVKGRRGSGLSTGAHLHYAVYMDVEGLLNDI